MYSFDGVPRDEVLDWLRLRAEGMLRPDSENAFQGMRLPGEDLTKFNFDHINIEGAELSRTNLHRVKMRYAVLKYADLRYAKLTYAKLQFADLSGANLRGADLTGADLRDAIIRKAKVEGANFTRANVQGADFQGTFMLDSIGVNKMKTMPQGKQPKAADFQKAIDEIFRMASENRLISVEIESGELHRKVGGYPRPGGQHRMPVCCSVMRKNLHPGDEIVSSPPSGNGATLKIRYQFPR